MSLHQFIKLWVHPDYPPKAVTEQALRTVEGRFDFAFPNDYRNAVLQHGLASPTIDLLDVIVDGELDMADLSKLLEPASMIERTEAWREMGLPSDLVAFASDCCGNLFCFSTATERTNRIFYFDHDFGTTREIAPSFSSWIDAFCNLSPHAAGGTKS
jgi:hypothetical protein